MGSIQAMVDHAIAIANDDSHGYSWSDRWNVDRDCSSLMYDSADAAGYDVGIGGDRYTGTMIDDFTNAGFSLHSYGSVDLFPGCILLVHNANRQHTEMYVGNGMNVGAHIAETGDVYGEPGDQTGFEISIEPNQDIWEWVLVPPDGDNYESEDEMQALFQPDDEGRMIWFDGSDLHDLCHPDEMEAIKSFYRESTGHEMPVFKFGSAAAPWARRFCDAVQHTHKQDHM